MIYIRLFLEFLKIGAISFGGGYGMISVMRDTVLARGWLTDGEIIDFIAVAESTPGPIAINMATFIGSSQAGFLGALVATAGVVLPAFIIILIVAAIIGNILRYAGVKAVLEGVRPCVIALIMSTALTMALDRFLGMITLNNQVKPDVWSIVILGIIVTTDVLYKRFRKKKVSAMMLIVISAACGMILI